MEDIASVVKKARDEFIAAHSEEQLHKYVTNLLETSLKNVVMHVLGFELSYGSQNRPFFRIDHCNGRAGESLIGQHVKEVAKDFFARTIPKFELTEEERKTLSEEVRREYLAYYKSEVRKYVAEKAKSHARAYVEQEAVALLKGDAEIIKLRLMETK